MCKISSENCRTYSKLKNLHTSQLISHINLKCNLISFLSTKRLIFTRSNRSDRSGILSSAIFIKRRESEIRGRRRDWMIQVAYCNTRNYHPNLVQPNPLSHARSCNRGMHRAMHRESEREKRRERFRRERWLKASRSVCMRFWGRLTFARFPLQPWSLAQTRLSTRTTAQPWSRRENRKTAN